MIQCPLCLNQVEKLKSNSHIIPRCLMAPMKEQGSFIAFENNQIISKTQDMKDDIVCNECEVRFGEDDRFAALFYRDANYFLYKRINPNEPSFGEIEAHHPEAKPKLLSFLVSVAVRGHLHLMKSHNYDLLRDERDSIFQMYLDRKIEESRMFATTYRLQEYHQCNSSPARVDYRGHKSIIFVIYGYQSLLFLDGRDAPLDHRSANISDELVIPIIEGNNHSVGMMHDRLISTYKNKLNMEAIRKRGREKGYNI